MGRRALRKIPEGLDYSAYHLSFESLGNPFDPNVVFPSPADEVTSNTRATRPLEIEAGSGKGLFLARAAAARPDVNFLGIEIARKYAEYIAARLARQQLDNAKVLQGDAEQFLKEFVRPGTVSAVHVYFPDPWWKKRHHKRRIMNVSFLTDVTRVLVPRGLLHFWTDVEAYFQLTTELIQRAIPSLRGPLAVDEAPAADHLDYHTHFERRTRLQGAPVFRAQFVKVDLPDNPPSDAPR